VVCSPWSVFMIIFSSNAARAVYRAMSKLFSSKTYGDIRRVDLLLYNTASKALNLLFENIKQFI